MKEQKIVVLLSLNNSDKNLILNGLKMATLFNKELCLLYNYPSKEKRRKEGFRQKLLDYTNPIKNEIPALRISTLLLSEKIIYLPEKLSDDLEAILMIAPSSQFSKYSKALTESPIPFLFINEKRETIPAYKNLILPIDLRKENSDSALWSSYFGRFNGTEIVAVAANDKDEENKKLVARNVVLSKKLFRKFDLKHQVYRGERSSFGNAFEALELAQSSNADFMILLSSSTITPIDYLVGLPERKIIKKAGSLPILVINPRKDNYILCD